MSKVKSQETGVALASQFTLKDVPSLLDNINQQIAELKGDREKAARITGNLMGVKVSEVSDPATLRGLYAYITKKAEAVNSFNDVFKKAAPTTDVPAYKEGGATAEQWQKEIVLQYREVTYKEQLEKLEAAKKILQDNLSADAKFQASLVDVANLLSRK